MLDSMIGRWGTAQTRALAGTLAYTLWLMVAFFGLLAWWPHEMLGAVCVAGIAAHLVQRRAERLLRVPAPIPCTCETILQRAGTGTCDPEGDHDEEDDSV